MTGGSLVAYGVSRTSLTVEKDAGHPLGCVLQQVGPLVFVDSHLEGSPDELRRMLPAGTILLRVNGQSAARSIKRTSAAICASSTLELELLTYPHARILKLRPRQKDSLVLASAGPYLRVARALDEGPNADIRQGDIVLALNGVMTTSLRCAQRALRATDDSVALLLPHERFEAAADWSAFTRLVSNSDRAYEIMEASQRNPKPECARRSHERFNIRDDGYENDDDDGGRLSPIRPIGREPLAGFSQGCTGSAALSSPLAKAVSRASLHTRPFWAASNDTENFPATANNPGTWASMRPGTVGSATKGELASPATGIQRRARGNRDEVVKFELRDLESPCPSDVDGAEGLRWYPGVSTGFLGGHAAPMAFDAGATVPCAGART